MYVSNLNFFPASGSRQWCLACECITQIFDSVVSWRPPSVLLCLCPNYPLKRTSALDWDPVLIRLSLQRIYYQIISHSQVLEVRTPASLSGDTFLPSTLSFNYKNYVNTIHCQPISRVTWYKSFTICFSLEVKRKSLIFHAFA